MKHSKNLLVSALIGLACANSSWANPALSAGVDGNGNIKSAIPTPERTLKFSVGYATASGANAGVTKVMVGNVDQTAALQNNFTRAELNLGLNYGIFDWLEGQIFVPYYMDKDAWQSTSSQMGDLVVGFKLNYPPYGDPGKRAYELSYLGQLVMPTATMYRDGGFIRNGWNLRREMDASGQPVRNASGTDYKYSKDWSPYHVANPIVALTLLNTINFQALHGGVPLRIHFNGGMALEAGNAGQESVMMASFGGELTGKVAGLFTSIETQVPIKQVERNPNVGNFPMALSVGVSFLPHMGPVTLDLSAGAKIQLEAKSGSDVTHDQVIGRSYTYNRVAPMTLFGGASVAFGLMAQDADRDGISDGEDRCADTPSGLSVDDLGCPNPDSDRDGICDAWVSARKKEGEYLKDCQGVDKCANASEDMDGFEDTDGCPEIDNDGDKILDGADKCLNDAEDLDGFEDEDGCPELDNDKDGIPDAVDQCVDEGEDLDSFQDADGCPELDNDQDGIPDTADKCPLKSETLNGKNDQDGCPD
jgi:hypothetical protein